MEIWDLYNEKKEKIGKDWIRGEKVPDGSYHLIVHIWIKNSEGKYLISQRSAWKKLPFKWECTGGSVIKGEDSLDGAIREVKEEVGIDLKKDEGKLLISEVRSHFNDIMDVWFWEYDGEVDLKNATTDEVMDVKWATKEEIKELFDSGDFVETLGYFFDCEW